MTYSLNEIDVMGKRAARGAGLTWGLAEEAGKAARWLCACDLPGAEILNEILTISDGKKYDDLAPISAEGVWHAPSGSLSPLFAGPALSDRAASLAAGHEIELGKTIKPLFLAPYLSTAAKLTGTTIELAWADATVTVTSQGILLKGGNVSATEAESVRCRGVEANQEISSEGVHGRNVDRDAWDHLSLLMHRYLAPDTEESRIAGAGAGLNDND
ncbi:MAG: DUF3726 domain-containing protein [Gammaproteobacteria bacterium]|nr:DUF3726 domain-containing protein [Gammaproteobacteria bacterium]